MYAYKFQDHLASQRSTFSPESVREESRKIVFHRDKML